MNCRSATILFGFNAESGMRHGAEAFLRNEFTGGATDAVGFVLNSDESSLKRGDELLLAESHGSEFFLALGGRTLFQHMIGRHGVIGTVGRLAGDGIHELFVVATSQFEFRENDLLEFFQFLIGITRSFFHGRKRQSRKF